MRLQDIHDLAETGLHIWAVTKDPTTFSAAVLLLKQPTARLNPAAKTAYEMLVKQREAYRTLFTEPLS